LSISSSEIDLRAKMSENRFEEFRELVLADDALQAKLRSLTNRNDFVTRLIELASEHGFEFTFADIEVEMRKSRLMWSDRGI
jgi:predicted ribosomally synthesized peptide with nif11-like leader